VIEDIATIAQVPIRILVGGGDERDVRRYINHHNAQMKGLKRKLRRLKAFVSKMRRRHDREN
jgi:hypothetical protein